MFGFLKSNKQAPVSEAQKAAAINNSDQAFWAFLIANNPVNINDTLKNMLKLDYLPYEPDAQKIGQAIGKLIEAKEVKKLQLVLDEFEFLPGTTVSKEVKQALINRINNR